MTNTFVNGLNNQAIKMYLMGESTGNFSSIVDKSAVMEERIRVAAANVCLFNDGFSTNYGMHPYTTRTPIQTPYNQQHNTNWNAVIHPTAPQPTNWNHNIPVSQAQWDYPKPIVSSSETLMPTIVNPEFSHFGIFFLL